MASTEPSKALESADEGQTSTAADSFASIEYTPAEEKKLVRKIDWILLPITVLLYLLSFLDRSNIGNAKIEGLVTDLGITDYSLLLSVSMQSINGKGDLRGEKVFSVLTRSYHIHRSFSSPTSSSKCEFGSLLNQLCICLVRSGCPHI